MRRFNLDLFFNAPPARLAEVVTTPAFLRADGLMHGWVEVRVVELERGPRRVHLRVDQTGPSPDPRHLGKTVTQSIFYNWDMEGLTCAWHRESDHPDGASVRGNHRVTATPTGCRYAMSWEVEVSIPLLGRVFEKKLEDGILERMHHRERLMRERVG